MCAIFCSFLTDDVPPIMSTILSAYLSAARLEGWYKCSGCNHAFWRDLTPDAKCPRGDCGQRSPPMQETVHDTQVVSKFHCVACSHEWTRHYDLAKVCQRCHARASPVSPTEAVGFVYARCHTCDRVSYEVQRTIGSKIQCRHCAPKSPTMEAATACSPHKRRSIDALLQAGVMLDLMAVTRTTMYEPGTRRQRGPRVPMATPTGQPTQNYYDILMQSTPPASPVTR